MDGGSTYQAPIYQNVQKNVNAWIRKVSAGQGEEQEILRVYAGVS